MSAAPGNTRQADVFWNWGCYW